MPQVDKETVRQKVLALCDTREVFVVTDVHLGCYRTSSPVDRLLRQVDHHRYRVQYLHGTTRAAEQGLRRCVSINNFAPSCPETVRDCQGAWCPAERLDRKSHQTEWLQNLLDSASLAGYRSSPRKV